MNIHLQIGQFVQTQQNGYQIIKKLNAGQFGVVYLAINNKTKLQVAIKQINKLHFSNPKVYELFQSEIKIQSNLKSSNIVEYMEVIDHQPSNSYLIVMEFCKDGDMQAYLKQHKYLPERQATAFLKQILEAFKCMHQKNCMHRDIKAANIFLHNGVAKLGDFGFAKQLEQTNITKTSLGTFATMAPEVFNQQEYSYEADMYSLGVVYYQMLFGVLPFEMLDPNPNKLFIMAQKEEFNFNRNGIRISKEAEDLIRKMMKYDKKQRITWKDIYNHPAISEEARFPADVMHLSIIASDNMFNPQQNSQFYQQNEQNMKQEVFSDNNNKYPNLYQNNNNNNHKVNNFKQSEEIKVDDIEMIEEENIQASNKQEQMNRDFEIGSQKYLHQRNLYGILIQMLHQILHFGEFKINYQIPAFLTSKKLIKMIIRFVGILEKKENTFQMKYFQEFSESLQYQNFIKLGKADLAKMREQYPSLLNECKSSITRLRIKSNTLNSHLISEQCNNQFENSYKECLINYSMGLREYYETNLTLIQKRKLFQHVILISDIACIDTFQKDNYNFDFESYKTVVYDTPFEQFESKLGEACMRIFG